MASERSNIRHSTVRSFDRTPLHDRRPSVFRMRRIMKTGIRLSPCCCRLSLVGCASMYKERVNQQLLGARAAAGGRLHLPAEVAIGRYAARVGRGQRSRFATASKNRTCCASGARRGPDLSPRRRSGAAGRRRCSQRLPGLAPRLPSIEPGIESRRVAPGVGSAAAIVRNLPSADSDVSQASSQRRPTKNPLRPADATRSGRRRRPDRSESGSDRRHRCVSGSPATSS